VVREPQIPPAALDAVDDSGDTRGWDATVVWSLVPERVTWRLTSQAGVVRYLKVSPLGTDFSLAAERDRMRWAETHLPVPHVLRYGADAQHEWLLTAAIDGTSAVDASLRAEPARLVPLLGQGLRRFHSVPWQDCPFDNRLDVALPAVRKRLETGRADPEWVIAAHGHRTARAALEFLERERPEHEDIVVCHGDYCVPNILIRDWRVAGFVDLGALGVADRWYDLAIALWSVTRNMGPGWEDLFLESYGIAGDPARIAYYHLLYDMQP